eukprot:XP_011435093.1 PREDICTED: uncharacterized protein LOC105333699 [Crassostrea gigas]
MRAFIAVVCLIAAVSARSLQKRSDDDGGHWEATWLASEDDVLKSTAEEVKGIKGKLLRDVDGLDNALKNLMSGASTKEDEEMAAGAFEGAVMLTMMDAKENSIPPMDLPIPRQCSKDAIAAIGSCPEQFMRIGECMRGACKAVKEALGSDKDLVQQVAFTKGVVALIAKGARGVGELAKACGYAEKKKRDFEDWAAAGLISEDELKNVDKAEVERVAGNLKKDMDAIDADLDNLLSEGIDGPAAEAVEKHLEASVELAELHEEKGTDAIKPARVEVPKGCRKEDFGADCEENFKRVVGCLKKAVKGMKETFDSDAPVVGKIAKVKGIVKLVSQAAGPIKELRDACTSKRSLAKFFN